MSEEIKIVTLGDIFKNIETEEKAFKFKDYIKDLQQKVEQLEKENKKLQSKINDYENPDDLALFYMWLDEKAKDKIKQLENIRKEAIEYLESEENIIDRFWKHDFRKYPDYNPFESKDEEEVRCVELYGYDDLLNILNNGSDKE